MTIYDFVLTKLIRHLQKKQNQHRRKAKRKKKLARQRKAERKALKVKKKAQAKKVKAQPKKPPAKKEKKALVKKRKPKPKPKPKRKPKPRPKPKPQPKPKPKPKKKDVDEQWVGDITHYFSNISVVVIKMISGNLAVGDTIHIKGSSSDFNQKVKSLQIESVDVPSVKKGELVGLKVTRKAKEGDRVFKVLK